MSAGSAVPGLAPAVAVVRRRIRAGRARLILIDGPSGAGKSALADALVAALPPASVRVVRLDEVYPGWYGLDAGAALAARALVAPLARGRLGRVPGWDWAAGAPGGSRPVRPGRPLVLEGCGAFGAVEPGCDGPDVLRVWVSAPDERRRERALRRDGGAYDAWWDVWDRQWRRRAAIERRGRGADLVVRD